uniref:Uncharacterized protein n=1 Tax=Amazona collaria TaxID=241587 RepID=A0A8B9ISA1_9PSIT
GGSAVTLDHISPKPSLKHADMAGCGGRDPHRLRPRPAVRSAPRRDLTGAHIESFNYAVSEGVYRAVQVCRGLFPLVPSLVPWEQSPSTSWIHPPFRQL